MSDVNHNLNKHHLDDVLFDRLVDDALPAEARRKLLASLDDEPGGWRRCAMAFLEAQAWRRSFGAMLQSTSCEQSAECKPVAERGHSATARATEGRYSETASRSNSNSVWKPIGLAAGIMLAFTLGNLLPSRNRVVEHANAPIPIHHDSPANALANHGAPPVGPMYASRENFAPLEGAPLAGAPGDDSLVLLVGGDGTPEQQIRVPLIESEAMNDQVGQYMRPAIPETLRRRLEQSGYRVESQRRYAPVAGEGGEQMVFPVDDMRIVPVDRPVY